MTEAERRIQRQAIEQEEYAQHIQAQIVARAMARAARFVEKNADTIMTIAETTDPRVKRALSHLA
jgi:hypothetical protein